MRLTIRTKLTLAALLSVAVASYGAEQETIQLPPAQMEGGRPLMEVLKDRKTGRSFSGRELSRQVLSNLLWAGFGINRPDAEKRTAPSASNMQEIDIYVALAEGLYVYEASGHTLRLVLPEDIRASTGTQSYVGDAAVNLVFVADFSKMGNRPEDSKVFYSAADTGFIGQNVHLFCASEGLAAVMRGLVDRQALAKKMGLREDQRVILAQSVGYPGEE